MNPTTKTENAPRKLKVTRTVFDMNEFESTTVGKMVDFKPVGDVGEALAELGNDQAKLLELINKGREAAVRDEAYRASEGWNELDEKNAVTATPFEGLITEPKQVNQTVSVLAKTVYGLTKGMTAEQKKTAKNAAMEMVKNTPAIREGLADEEHARRGYGGGF
jgi:hypothetical protein